MNRTKKQTGSNSEVVTDTETRKSVYDDNELEMAWLWFAEQAASDEARRYCFERALLANPASQLAKLGLEHLHHKQAAQHQHLQTGTHRAAQHFSLFRQRSTSFIVE